MTNLYQPLNSLQEGHWFKLICGASYQHLPAIRNLTLAYTLAGADCIDVAADPAVIRSAREALTVAARLRPPGSNPAIAAGTLPWLMVSLNDGEDPHFRKAEFNPDRCPPDCPRPCEAVCPAAAIAFPDPSGFSGVIAERCYGCGRCLPVCPIQQITTQAQVAPPESIGPLILAGTVDALEIHTQVGRLAGFGHLWRAIAPYAPALKLLAVSCADGEDLIDYLWQIYQILSPLPCPLVWQTDGRPMSGDLGDGTTRAAVKLGQKVLAANLPGYVQLAGGTNRHTVTKLRQLGLLKSARGTRFIAGVAYGSYGRSLLAPIQTQLEARSQVPHLEVWPDLLQQAIALAQSLVGQLKPLHASEIDQFTSASESTSGRGGSRPPAVASPLPNQAP